MVESSTRNSRVAWCFVRLPFVSENISILLDRD